MPNLVSLDAAQTNGSLFGYWACDGCAEDLVVGFFASLLFLEVSRSQFEKVDGREDEHDSGEEGNN